MRHIGREGCEGRCMGDYIWTVLEGKKKMDQGNRSHAAISTTCMSNYSSKACHSLGFSTHVLDESVHYIWPIKPVYTRG